MLSYRLPRCLEWAKNGLNWGRLYHVSKVTYHTFIQPDLPDIQFPAPCQTFPVPKDMWEKCPELSHYRRRVDRFLPMSAFIKLESMGSQRFFPIVPSWPLFPDRPITQPRPARVSALCSINAKLVIDKCKTCARQMQNADFFGIIWRQKMSFFLPEARSVLGQNYNLPVHKEKIYFDKVLDKNILEPQVVLSPL